MRLINRFSRTFLGLGMLLVSATGLGACGPDYTLFNVHVQFKTLPQPQAPVLDRNTLDTIADCTLTIMDGKNVVLVYPMNNSTGTGCGPSSVTPTTLGRFSYSTSRASGTLTFNFVGQDINRTKTVVTGTASGQVKAYPPEVFVEIYAAP
jgi:hypothetical protein